MIWINRNSADRDAEYTSSWNALGQWRDFAFDANGNPIEETLTVNNARIDSASAVYDGADRRVQSLDAAGNATAWELDARGNPLSVTDPDGYALGFEYDAMDRWVTAQDKAGNSVARSLDISGRQRAVTDPNGNTTTQTWWDATKNGLASNKALMRKAAPPPSTTTPTATSSAPPTTQAR